MADAPYRLTIGELVKQSYENAEQHGFWDDERTSETIPSKLALIMSEAGEALESYRDPNSDNMVPVPADVLARLLYWAGAAEPSNSGERHEACVVAQEALDKWKAKPKGFDVELADTMIRIADLAGALGIDLEAAIQKKHAYNLGRPRKHGRVV